MDHGELSRLAGWLDTLPEAIMNARPWLCVAHAWVLVYTGQLGAVEPCLQNAEAALHEAVSQDQRIAGNLAAIRAYAAILQGDNQHAEELARAALKHLTENDLLARGFATRVLGLVHRATGRLEAAAQFYIEASRISRAAGNNHLTLTVLFDLGYLQFLQGRLHQAFDTCQEALKLAEEHQPRGAGQLPVTGYIYALLGRVLCEWNDLDTAVDYARRGAELSEQWGVAEIMVDCYLHFAIVLQSIGDRLGALSAIQKMRESAQRLSEWYITAAEPYEARLHLVLGNVEEAFRWAESQRDGFADNVELDVYTEFAAMTLARVHIVQGRWREALRLLERVLRLTEQMQADDLVIEILILQALALQKADKLDAALDRLTHALSLAEPAGYVRLFIDEGAPMGDLLRRAAARGHHVDYVSRLLSALQVDQDRRAARLQPLSRLQPLIEPLTDRELEVLRLLALGLSNQEIADTLVIALQTAQKHLKNIYSKLAVPSRVESVSRARELGFL